MQRRPGISDIPARVPVVTWESVAGWRQWPDILYPPEVLKWVSLPRRWTGVVVALRVPDDSMQPEFVQGDLVGVSLGAKVKRGQFIVVSDNEGGHCALRQLVSDGNRFLLKPVNQRYAVRRKSAASVVQGVVVMKYRHV